MTEKGYSRLVAENMVYSGGLNIYATIDTKVQNALDEVWANADNFPNTEKYGEIPQSAMVITDKQGDIVGIAGGRGEKTSSRGFFTRLTHAVSRVPRSSSGDLWSRDGCRYCYAGHHGLRPCAHTG